MDPAVTFLLGGLGCVLTLLGVWGWWGTWRTWAFTRKRWSGWAPLMLLAMGAGLVLLAVGFEVMYASFPPIQPLATAIFVGASVLFVAAVVFLFFGAPYALLPRWIRRRRAGRDRVFRRRVGPRVLLPPRGGGRRGRGLLRGEGRVERWLGDGGARGDLSWKGTSPLGGDRGRERAAGCCGAGCLGEGYCAAGYPLSRPAAGVASVTAAIRC